MPVKKIDKKVVKKADNKVSQKPAAKVTIVKKVAKTSVAKATLSSKPTATQSNVVFEQAVSAKKITKKLEPRKLIKPLIFLLVVALVYLLKDEIIVASVNGRPVTRFALIRNLEKQGASNVLENMTLQMLVEQELKKAGVVITAEELDAEIATVEAQLAEQGQSLDDLLEAQGYTRDQIKEQLSLSKSLEKLLADDITVSDDEVQAYYEENKANIGEDVVLADIAESIKSQLKQEKLSTAEQAWFAKIKESAKINYYKFEPSTSL
jgi:lambda repressor-like predicted transcriptional regulator